MALMRFGAIDDAMKSLGNGIVDLAYSAHKTCEADAGLTTHLARACLGEINGHCRHSDIAC